MPGKIRIYIGENDIIDSSNFAPIYLKFYLFLQYLVVYISNKFLEAHFTIKAHSNIEVFQD